MAVPDPAAALNAFCAALNRCGFDEAAQDAVVAISGIAHIAMLGMLAVADIARLTGDAILGDQSPAYWAIS